MGDDSAHMSTTIARSKGASAQAHMSTTIARSKGASLPPPAQISDDFSKPKRPAPAPSRPSTPPRKVGSDEQSSSWPKTQQTDSYPLPPPPPPRRDSTTPKAPPKSESTTPPPPPRG